MSDNPHAGPTAETHYPTAEVIPDGPSPSGLTVETVAGVLKDFESWLAHASRTDLEPAPSPRGEPVDLHTLLGQFLALKQEIHLQTRAVRSQQEQNAETLRNLARAMELLTEKPERTPISAPASDEILRPVLKTLVDVHDALTLASREVARVRETVLPLIEQLQSTTEISAPPEDQQPQPKSSWASWFATRSKKEQSTPAPLPRSVPQMELARRTNQALAALMDGYTMSLQRIERALGQHGLETIPTSGQPFDPERMEVLETVSDSGQPPGAVVDEVRRGYFWKGKLFRFAQVRVSRP